MDLVRPEKQQSQNASAVFSRQEALAAGGVPDNSKLCEVGASTVTIKISPAALEYLEKTVQEKRVPRLLAALRFCEFNERPRVQSFDFAMADGARTYAEVDAWHAKNGIHSRSTKLPSLEVPGSGSISRSR